MSVLVVLNEFENLRAQLAKCRVWFVVSRPLGVGLCRAQWVGHGNRLKTGPSGMHITVAIVSCYNESGGGRRFYCKPSLIRNNGDVIRIKR
jgi:hypothetical protein